MAKYLSDDEAFGAASEPAYLSDEQAFGTAPDVAADAEQEVIGDRANNWRNRSIFKSKPTAGAGRGSADDPRRLDRAQESEWTKEVRGNLPTIDGNLQISAPEPKKPREYKSVLEGVRMTGGGFDEREAQRLSRRDYAEQAEREAGFAARGSQRMTEARKPILSDRQRFSEENPITAGFAQSAANTLVGALNAPAVVAGLANESLVKPLSRAVVGAAGGDERLLPNRAPNMPLVDDLRSIGSEYASQLSRKTPGQAWDDGDFGRWLMTQMSANSFSAAQSLGALFVPGAQASLLASMGAVSAGNAYTEGDSAKASALKGLVEAGSEMLPLKAAEKIKDLVLAIPEPMRQKALADAGKRLLAAGTAVTTNSLVGALEETVAQIGGNAIDIGISGKNKSLFDEVDRAAIVGGAFGGGMSAPVVIETAMGPTSPEQRRAMELASALDGGGFTQEGIDAAVANTLRTEPGTSSSISPAATSIISPAPQADAKAMVESARDAALADIGKAQSVDEAVASANASVNLAGRAVQLDSERLLNDALQSAGIADALQPAEAAASAQDAPLNDGQPAVAVSAEANFSAANTVTPSRVVWTGRRGDGYATPEDANRALNERQRLRPSYDWTVQQNPEGRYVLEGQPKGQEGAAQATSATGNTMAAPMAQNALQTSYPTEQAARVAAERAGIPVSAVSIRPGPNGFTMEPAQRREPVRELQDQADQLQRLSDAMERQGDDASSLQLYTERDDAGALDVYSAGDSGRPVSAVDRTRAVAFAARRIGRAVEVAFGWKPTLVTGLPNAYGVQHGGQAYVDVARIAKSAKTPNAIKAYTIQTIFHETTHNLEKSQDAQGKSDYAALREVVLRYAKPDAVRARVAKEGGDQTYGENEVVADVSGDMALDSKFWSLLYDYDNGSTMRRIVYKFMENAAKLIKVVKGSRLDVESFIPAEFVDEVREVAAQVWASKAKRGGSLFGSQDQTISKSQADDSRPGVSAEVAPDPRNQEAAQKWGKLTEPDKLGITKEVMDKLAAKVFDKMGLAGWGVEYTSGMFEGGINPSAIIRAPQGTDAELLGEVMRVFGYLLDQKGMVAFDESNTASESQAGFVKVVLPEGLSTDKIDAIRKEIAAKVPQAEGDTVRDGAIVYGNFSAYNDKIETLDDSQFKQAIEDAIAEIDVDGTFDVAGPFRFHSEYDQAYWDDAYDPKGREAYLEKTRYGSSDQQEALPGRDGVRRWGRDSVFRPWLEALARSTDAQVARLVGDRQPRSAYGAAPDARADRARPEQPAQPGGGDRQGRPDDVRGGVTGVVPAGAGGAGKDIRGAVHYGKVGGLKSLSGAMNGTGIRGAENGRVAQSADPRIRQRVYFYLPVAGGIPQPESGLGQHVYKADLSNLYDTASQKMRLPADSSAMESAILDAGYSGFFNEAQGTVVMFGSVPVSYEGTSDQFNKVQRQPKAVKQKSVTRAEGDMLVRKPEGAEVMEIIKAQKAGLDVAAPSFKMQFGEARVLASESEIADAVFESVGANFRFGEPSYSRDFDELGAFNLDAAVSDMTDAEMEKFGIEPMTEKDMDAIQAELMADFEAEFGSLGEKPAAPTADAIKDAGLFAESAFEPGRIVQKGERFEFQAPAYAEGLTHSVRIRKGADTPGAIADFRNGSSFFINQGAASQEAVEKLVNRQIAGAYLHKAKHDIAGAYRKGTVLKLADSWRRIAKAGGAFKLGVASKGAGFSEVAESMGAFKGYEVAELRSYTGFEAIFTREKDGREFRASINDNGQSIDCCTMGLEGSGGLGTEFYAVLSSYAANNDKRFVADDMLSGVNTYRRTEQALSFALRSGDTGVILPGLTNRVYGYNSKPKTREDHDKNLARLALAGMRNVEELFPDVRRLRYDPETDKFTDSRGRDAEPAVKDALANKDARAFGLGRSTIARAVITSQIIKGEEVKAEQFASPIAYSLADVGMDEPMAESWGDERGGVTPGLRGFMAGSRIVHEDGRPVVMYHGTTQDVHAFRAKQAGAIFLSYSPRFAGDFAALSGQWMLDHWKQVLTPEQQETAKQAAAAAVMADKTIKMSERKAMKQSIMDGEPEGMALDAMNQAAQDMMPSGENILPVFVRAMAPFDFREKSHVNDVVGLLFDKNMAGEGDKITIHMAEKGGDRASMTAKVMRELMTSGAWDVIESPEVQEAIRELGHDGFFVKENGQVNLAVYEPTQVKSVFNRGTYDPMDERLSYSRAALDDYMVRRNKTMPTVSGASAQEADIALAVKAINAARTEIERGNKTVLPVPIGRTPHVLNMLGARSKMLRIDTSILRKVLFDKHADDFAGVSVEEFVRALYLPAMVLNGRAAGEYEIVTAITTKTGPLMVPVMDAGNSFAAMSAYAKNVSGGGGSLLNRLKGGALLYADPVLAQSALTGRDSAPARGIITREAQFSSAPPRGAQPGDGDAIEFIAPSAGITVLGAQFPRTPQAASRSASVNQDDLSVKPLNPNFVGWDQVRGYIIDGIAQRKVKDDVALMRWIGDRYKGDWSDAPSFSRDDIGPLGFYSALARSVDGIKATAAPAEGWKEIIKGLVNKGQAKQDEVDWTGLADWMDLQQGRVTKAQVLEYLDGNGVQLQEVVLGDEGQEAAARRWMNERAQLEFAMPFDSLDESDQDYLRGKADDANISVARESKYGQYTLPGGENYREVLLTLPERARLVTLEEVNAARAKISSRLKPLTQQEYDEMAAAGEIAKAPSEAKPYKSSHWDATNILAHIRVNDRTDADGKRVLFVEEIQSDFGQDGKKKGFGLTPSEQRRADALSAKMDAGTASESERAEARELGKKIVNPIPAAPFVTKTEGWLNLALKRVIAMAVDGGYDKVAFVTGQQSAERYDLSKQVDSVHVWGDSKDGYYFEAKKDGRNAVADKGRPISATELADTIGKELADQAVKLVAETGEAKFSGDSLRVGGAGMIAFYDKIVPNAVKALLKKVGGERLQQVVFGGEAKGGRFVVFDDDSGERLFRTDNRKEAAEYILAYPGDASIKEVEGSAGVGLVGEQPGFAITPAMREKASDGMPLFSRANGGFDLPAENWSAKTRRKMQDYFLRAQVVQRAIASQGGVVDEQTDFYRAEELSHGRTAALMQDFADQQVQPLMEKAVKLGVELDELSLYAYAMHAKERNAYIASIDSKLQDGGSGMTNAEADSILQLVDLSGDKAKFEELHNDLMTITRGNRLAMLADGLITQQEFEALEGAYEYYVPLRGFEKLDEDGNPAPARSAGKGFNIRGAETLKAKGRVSRAGQIIENIIHDHQRTIARGERNHVAKVFLNFVLKNPDADLWEIDARTTRKSIDRKTGRIARDTAIEKGEDTIAVKLQGQEVYIRIKDEMLLRALRKSHSDETGQLTSDLMRSIGLYSTLLRNTLTRYNPEFAVVNAMRDVGFGATAVLDELGEKGVAKYLAHYAGALAVSARNESKKLDAAREWDKWFYEFKAAGGTTSGFYAKGLDEIGGDIRDMMIEAGAAPKDWSEKLRFNKATRAAKAALSVLEYAGSVSENAARVAAYRTAREMGKTPSQAASIAKNLTTNFDRKGEYGQMVNALYLFYNAAIQGTHRTAKMLQNPKVWGYMGGVTAGAVALALASASAGGDDPDDGMAYWDKIPAYVKERNIIIMLPPGAQVEGAEEVGTKGRYLTIPVQYGLNIFHVLGYQIADVARNQADPTRGVSWKKGGINIASAMAGAFNPFGGAVDLTNGSSVVQAILPTLFDFPYQLASGTNAFGRDVAPFKSPFDSKPDSQNSNVRQAGSPAEHVAQWLNEVTGGSEYESGAIDVSAGTLENVVRGLTGGTGAFIYDVLALGGKWADYVGGDDPDLFIKDIPIARRLMGETAGDIDQGLFYERRKAIQDARAAEKGAEEAGGEITDKEKLAMASMSSDASKYTRWLSQVRKEMKEAQRDEGMTVQERRLKMRELRAERDRLTSEFNASFTETMRQELSDFGQK